MKTIGGTPIFIKEEPSKIEEHIASGVIGGEVYRVLHDFGRVYVTFPNRPNKDSFAIDLIKLVESAYFFDKIKSKRKLNHLTDNENL